MKESTALLIVIASIICGTACVATGQGEFLRVPRPRTRRGERVGDRFYFFCREDDAI